MIKTGLSIASSSVEAGTDTSLSEAKKVLKFEFGIRQLDVVLRNSELGHLKVPLLLIVTNRYSSA